MPTETNAGIYSIDPKTEDDVIPMLQDAWKTKKTIRFQYKTELLTLGCLDKLTSGYAIIESVEIIEK